MRTVQALASSYVGSVAYLLWFAMHCHNVKLCIPQFTDHILLALHIYSGL
jgi:hypothetical protein